MLACTIIAAPFALAFLTRAFLAAPNAAMLLPVLAALATVAGLASYLPG